MAGDWIKMRTNLATDPKVIGIAERIGVPVPHAIGCLYMLWSWASEHTIDGNAPSVTVSWIDRYLGVEGFGQALSEVDWLQVIDAATGRGVRLPRFDSHCSQTAKQRALTARRVAKTKLQKGNADGNAQVTVRALPREDERREEEEQTPLPPSGDNKGSGKTVTLKPSLADLSIPAPLAVPAFRDAWKRWATYQSQRPARERQTPAGGQQWLARVARENWTVDRAIKAIELSIERGWRGIYEGAGQPNNTQPKKPTGDGGLALGVW